MTSWYHFSKSIAGSHMGPAGSCCSIWRETPRVKGVRARHSDWDRCTKSIRSFAVCACSAWPSPGTPGTTWLSHDSSWTSLLLMGPVRTDSSARKAQDCLPCTAGWAGLKQTVGQWAGSRAAGSSVGCQEPKQPHLQLTPSHASSPGRVLGWREGNGTQTSAEMEREERDGRGGAAQPEDEEAGGSSGEVAGAQRPPRMPESCSTVTYWAERSRLNWEMRLQGRVSQHRIMSRWLQPPKKATTSPEGRADDAACCPGTGH